MDITKTEEIRRVMRILIKHKEPTKSAEVLAETCSEIFCIYDLEGLQSIAYQALWEETFSKRKVEE